MVALEENSADSISIVFYEVKTFNDPRLRAKRNAAVIGQLDDYEQATVDIGDEKIAKAYHQVRCDLVRLKRSVGGPAEISSLIEKVANDSNILKVNHKPRLIVVDYDIDQWNGAVWQEHLKKLTEVIGIDRVIGWGNAADVKIGPEQLKPGAGRRYSSNR